jgi:putative SOS response-associated peptidase YedK
MCGRFTYKLTWDDVVRLYNLSPEGPRRNLQAHYNICPTDPVDVVASDEGKRSLVSMRWGLVPRWWKKPLKELRVATFNARAETVAEKPMFRDAFRRNRCLMSASGYYEWQDTPNGKQPWYFTRRDGQPPTFAAIHDQWTNPETKEPLRSVSMVITTPNKLVAEVHDRMPVILEPVDYEQWERGDAKDVADLMKPADEDILQKWPVSKRVNSSRAPDDDPTLIDKIDLSQIRNVPSAPRVRS